MSQQLDVRPRFHHLEGLPQETTWHERFFLVLENTDLATVTIPSTPPIPAVSSPSTTFDIVPYYNELLRTNPSLTPPIAAIESLISLLATTPLTTISETLSLLSKHSTKLLNSQRNPIPLSAGTDLFQRYLVASFQQRPSQSHPGDSDFSTLRQHILTNSSLFVRRAAESRHKIAHHALPFIRDDSTIITYDYSRVVHTLLTHAAESGRYFNVLYILPCKGPSKTLTDSIAQLNKLSIPTATIPLHALNYALASMHVPSPPPQFIVGAAAVLENGSIITQFGTHQIGLTAKSCSIPLYVAVESYKFVRNFPLGYGQTDLAKMGVRQDVLKFSAGTKEGRQEGGKGQDKELTVEEDMIEITPPELISALVTETGIMTPNAVSEELIKLWF